MRRRVRLLGCAIALCAPLILLAGCGGGSDSSATAPSAGSALSGAHAWEAALRAEGWQAREVAGMPQTISGAPQVVYFEATSPAGAKVDVQVFATPAQASAEAAAAERKLKGFSVVTVADSIVFTHGSGHGTVPPAALRGLREARRSGP